MSQLKQKEEKELNIKLSAASGSLYLSPPSSHSSYGSSKFSQGQNTSADTELNSSSYNSDDTNTCTLDDSAKAKLNEAEEASASKEMGDLICKTCSKLFDNSHRLQRHMLSHDSNPDLRKFKCDFCDKAFKFKHHLKVRDVLLYNTEKSLLLRFKRIYGLWTPKCSVFSFRKQTGDPTFLSKVKTKLFFSCFWSTCEFHWHFGNILFLKIWIKDFSKINTAIDYGSWAFFPRARLNFDHVQFQAEVRTSRN